MGIFECMNSVQSRINPNVFPILFQAIVKHYSFPMLVTWESRKNSSMLVDTNPQHWFLGNRRELSMVRFVRGLRKFAGWILRNSKQNRSTNIWKPVKNSSPQTRQPDSSAPGLPTHSFLQTLAWRSGLRFKHRRYNGIVLSFNAQTSWNIHLKTQLWWSIYINTFPGLLTYILWHLSNPNTFYHFFF